MAVGEILTSAFSEILGAPVVSTTSISNEKKSRPVHSFSRSISTRSFVSSMIGVPQKRAGGGKVSGLSHEVENLSLDEMSVCVKTLNG